MVKKTAITFIFIVTFPFFLLAQTERPTTYDLTIEVLNEALKSNKDPQIISAIIQCGSAQDLQVLTLKMNNLKSVWSVISAKLNEQALWLIKSDVSANNEKVLAWNHETGSSELKLYPSVWQVPYVLELEIQINVTNTNRSLKEQSETLNMEATISGVSYRCAADGRGNQLNIE
jgi:hypothetical protein